MRNWHDEHVHWNNKIKEREKQMLQPLKKILQIDIKNVGGAVIYSKDISGFFITKKKKTPNSAGELEKK